MQSKFLICPPEETTLSEVWGRWHKALNLENHDYLSLGDVSNDKDITLLVFIGNNPLQRLIEDTSFHPLFNNKVIYHIGGIPALNSTTLKEIGVKAYLGYGDRAPTFIINTPEAENSFRDTFFVGLQSLANRENLSTALQLTKRAWLELRSLSRTSASPFGIHNRFVSMFAKSNEKHLKLEGDSHWRSQVQPRLISYRELIIRADRPRVEVINLSPILLEWLQEDPTRVAKLSPEQFENLVADRLTRLGLVVIKTGTTFTPDGGIDLIAYPQSSSVPYLLAAQIKHSRKNRPVSASVVRDFRGAIAPLPIDIGMIVTNTSFTPDAEWTARQLPKIIRLRDLENLKRWLANELDESMILKDFPNVIEVAPRLVIPIPRSIE